MADSEKKLGERCPELIDFLARSPDSMYLKDLAGRFDAVSESKARNSEVSWQDMIGKTDFDFMPRKEALKSAEDDAHIIQTGESIIDREEERTRPDGTKYWVSASKFPRRNPGSDEIIGTGGISRDISARKAIEEHTFRMVAIAGHDIAGPLMQIRAAIGRVARGSRGEISESASEVLRALDQNIIGLESIVRQYLSVSALLGAATGGEKEELDLRGDIVDPLLAELFEEIKSKNIIIDDCLGGIPEGRIVIRANRNWLGIVYRNLLKNAVAYTPAGGKIAVGFEDRPDIWLLNVYSSSARIPDTDKEKIFQMFASGSGGTGLGLAVSRQLMRKHGGDLWCEDGWDGSPNFVFILQKKDE